MIIMNIRILSWRVEGEKVIFKVLIEENEQRFEKDVELPNDIYGELLTEGPPTEEKQIRSLLDEVYDVQKKRILSVSKIDEEISNKIKDLDNASKALQIANDNIEINKWKGVVGAISRQLTALRERRHLAKFLMQEEGQLQARLARLMRGK